MWPELTQKSSCFPETLNLELKGQGQTTRILPSVAMIVQDCGVAPVVEVWSHPAPILKDQG